MTTHPRLARPVGGTDVHDLATISATRALSGFRAREFSPVEVLEAVLSRIQADASRPEHERINAVVHCPDQAHAQAQTAADAWARGEDTSTRPLLGVPVATKEKHGLAGEPLSEGLTAHADHTAEIDHPVIERVRAAGGVLHARTASPELSCATVTHSPLWGVTRNPWNTQFSPGGSSGGAGAALAAGFAPLATASDIAGSTRIPAGFTGTVGYKAPYGRVPGRPPLSSDWYRGDGPMARSVEDVALLYRVICGVHPIDHTTVPGEPIPATSGEDAAAWFKGARIGVSLELGDYPVHPDVRAATIRAAELIAQAGAQVVEVRMPWSSERFRQVSMAHFGHLLAHGMRRATADCDVLAEYTRQFMDDAEAAAREMTFFETLAAEAQLQGQLADAMADLDVLLTPVSATNGLPADGRFPDGIDVTGPDGPVHLEHYWQAHMTVPFNIANRCPVMSTPAGVATNGVPVGVQWVGRPYEEATVFRAAAAWEAFCPWSGLAPAHDRAGNPGESPWSSCLEPRTPRDLERRRESADVLTITENPKGTAR